MFAAAACLFALVFLAASARADKEAFFQSERYNSGDYGRYVTQSFKTSPIRAPWINFEKPFTGCDDGSLLFIAPRGEVADSSPYILDVNGSLVWAPEHPFGETYNFQVQEYNGEKFMVFWEGDDAVGGHGAGQYYMYDQHYQLRHTIRGANGVDADLHSFSITPEGTVTCTLYAVREVDLSSVRPENPRGFVWESMIQEIDIETGKALFEWRASDHFNVNESFINVEQSTEEVPWDFFHINSVEKDAAGNYLISSRFLRCIAYISGTTGEVLWQLGGKRNSFRDLSGGDATTLVGQHDAHWADDHTAISFFDNRGDWYFQLDSESKGTRVRLDLDEMTAELMHSYKHPRHIYSTSQGSYTTLPNGNVLMGYGFTGAMTEFSRDGEVLCDAYFQPANRFGTGDVQSYRNLKFNWTGIPKTDPAVVLAHGSLYMSWLGSTETRAWLLQDASNSSAVGTPASPAVAAVAAAAGVINDVTGPVFVDRLTIDKVGFETRHPIGRNGLCMRRLVRVIALDAHGNHLATSHPVDIGENADDCGAEWLPDEPESEPIDDKAALEHLHNGNDNEIDDDDDDYDRDEQLEQDVEDLQLLFALGILAVLSALLVVWFTLGPRSFRPSFWRQRDQDDGNRAEKRHPSSLFSGLHSLVSAAGSRTADAPRWMMDTYYRPRRPRPRRDADDEEDSGGSPRTSMLSDVDLSDGDEDVGLESEMLARR